jgi:hypothetical protein
MPQKPLASLFENERRKASAFLTPPDVQLNHILAVVDAPAERMATTLTVSKRAGLSVWEGKQAGISVQFVGNSPLVRGRS